MAAETLQHPMRASVLKEMARSPAHARHALLSDGGAQSKARDLGSAVHALVLGGPPVIAAPAVSDGVRDAAAAIKAGKQLAIYPGPVRRGAQWNAFAAEHESDTVVTSKELDQAVAYLNVAAGDALLVTQSVYELANRCAYAVRANADAARVLCHAEAINEQRIDWTWSGRAWRSTPDSRHFRVLSELKTTRCAEPGWFAREAARRGYHIQLAIYRHAIEVADGVRPRDVYLFAVETAPPYAVVSYRLSEATLELGWRRACEWHARWLECEQIDRWPGYVDGIAELHIHDADVEAEMLADSDDGTRAEVDF